MKMLGAFAPDSRCCAPFSASSSAPSTSIFNKPIGPASGSLARQASSDVAAAFWVCGAPSAAETMWPHGPSAKKRTSPARSLTALSTIVQFVKPFASRAHRSSTRFSLAGSKLITRYPKAR